MWDTHGICGVFPCLLYSLTSLLLSSDAFVFLCKLLIAAFPNRCLQRDRTVQWMMRCFALQRLTPIVGSCPAGCRSWRCSNTPTDLHLLPKLLNVERKPSPWLVPSDHYPCLLWKSAASNLFLQHSICARACVQAWLVCVCVCLLWHYTVKNQHNVPPRDSQNVHHYKAVYP